LLKAIPNHDWNKTIFKSVLEIDASVDGYRDTLRVEAYGIATVGTGKPAQTSNNET
jgi:hypothetical protein